MKRLRSGYKNVLILGGYGKAGRTIATLLSKQMHGCIGIAGRSLEKAEACVRDLQDNRSTTVSMIPLAVDATQPTQLSSAFAKQDLVIVCVPLDKAIANNIAAAIVDSTADYIDIVPGSKKYRAFKQYETAITKKHKCFVLDAGVDPGLPGWLARYTASLVKETQEVILFAKYRDRDIGRAGIQDILEVSSLKPKIFDGQWRTTSPWRMKWPQYPSGFGRGVSVPVFLQELEHVPQREGLEKLALYHSGVNNISDLVLMAWKLGLNRVLPETKAVDWFQVAMQNCTPKPTGVTMMAEAKTASEKVWVKLWHHDLYRATAIPTTLAATRMLYSPHGQPGCWFLGEWVDTAPFKEALEEMGFHFEIQRTS